MFGIKDLGIHITVVLLIHVYTVQLFFFIKHVNGRAFERPFCLLLFTLLNGLMVTVTTRLVHLPDRYCACARWSATPYGNSTRTLDTVAFGKAEKEPRDYCYYNVTSLLFNNSLYSVLLFGVKYIVRISEKLI